MTDHLSTNEQIRLPAILRNEAARLVTTFFGKDWQIADCAKLNHKMEIQVMRLTLQHHECSEIKTAILKFYDPTIFSSNFSPPDFLEEQVNYQYLERLRPRFNRFPAIYGYAEQMFLMEDLGPDTYSFESLDHIIDTLADTLYNLHQASRGTRDMYEQVRTEAGLSADIRRYSPEGCAAIFQKGCSKLLEFFSLIGLEERPQLERLLLQAQNLVLTPSTFWSFVHDDLADRRQSVVLDGRVILVDFEHGKFFHSLIDLSKLLIGKIERDNDKKAMIYHHANVPTEIGQAYYNKWLNAGNAPPYADFQLNFDAANIFQTMLIIGRLSELQGAEMFYSLAGNIKMILPRLTHHLKGSVYFSELTILLDKFCTRIMV
ncbi:hypothetical protein HDF18_08065 [Mucilaginibacter sp. X5P1]|uniref:hypothetical protein n=1 Tax=Mucilaginibacter sp. X5P1 TaxID=2723088 RepID=UPI00160C80C0|nr:hypothetical protein [Mucilaginibacter sp. X5P1]MBB6137608.1 hypothetical protein [Mucilaginibacter sp. X5P1]